MHAGICTHACRGIIRGQGAGQGAGRKWAQQVCANSTQGYACRDMLTLGHPNTQFLATGCKRHTSCTKELLPPMLPLQYLISRKVDINALDWSCVSPLHLCCIENHISVAKALLKAGADCKPADKEGDLPLHWAATRGHSQVRSRQPWLGIRKFCIHSARQEQAGDI